ncbi:hypothetical protein [Ochrobactrum sp. AN78]|uniref:Pam3-gp28 family putative phage holin n=1 Tax=Ochrobactrum sp. AN78 TaxID=3039853 RepID=UPI002989D866|nr:hypothetical protein [Ochrobactrum sp. AN78]MDH7790742.1 hypothetical protein [Ochrobactrum sp. AN78]
MEISLLIPLIRQVLQAVGSYLIARGYLDTGAADALTGALVNGIVFVWWLVEHLHIRQRLKATEVQEAKQL